MSNKIDRKKLSVGQRWQSLSLNGLVVYGSIIEIISVGEICKVKYIIDEDQYHPAGSFENYFLYIKEWKFLPGQEAIYERG